MLWHVHCFSHIKLFLTLDLAKTYGYNFNFLSASISRFIKSATEQLQTSSTSDVVTLGSHESDTGRQ